MVKLINEHIEDFDKERDAWKKFEKARQIHYAVMMKHFNGQATDEEAIEASKNLEKTQNEWRESLPKILASLQ